jgi:ADP-heptose:LPS heptosyltransferase
MHLDMRLLIFKVNQLGDNVVYLPVVQSLRRLLKNDDLIIVTSPVAAPLYSTACEGVEVRTFATAAFNGAWRRPWKVPGLIAQVRAARPDACLLGDDQGNVAHLLARLSGADLTVGVSRKDIPLSALLRHSVTLDFNELVARQNWRIASALAEKLGKGTLPCDGPPAPDLSAFGRTEHGSVLVHAGASRAYKRWPMDRFVALANAVSRSHPVMWIDQGSKEETALATEVKRVRPESLAQFIRVMAGAKLLVGNNSGPMNIAAALGVPGIIFSGPSRPNWDPAWHRERFDLLRNPHLACQPCDKAGKPVNACQNLQHPMACMDFWAVEAVLQKVLMRLR